MVVIYGLSTLDCLQYALPMAQSLVFRPAQLWHGATVIIGGGALVLQLILVLSGASVLAEEGAPSLATRLLRLVSYFTIQSNVLVVITAIPLIRTVRFDSTLWRVARLAALIGISITGLVHWFFLRPLLQLSGGSLVADKLLHVVVPLLAVVGWLLFGPRPRVTWAALRGALIWPVLWLVATLVVGAVSGWYPYPFLNVGQLGAGPVALAVLGVTLLFLVLGALTKLGDRRLPGDRAVPRDLP